MSETPAPPPTIQSPPPAPLPPDEKQVRIWSMLCHLSALSMLVGVPLGNVLGPLIVWLIKKNEMPSVNLHGKAALNFQLTILIAAAGSMILGVITMAICIGFIFIILAMGLGLCGMIFAVIAAIQANDGKEYHYPYSFNLIK